MGDDLFLFLILLTVVFFCLFLFWPRRKRPLSGMAWYNHQLQQPEWRFGKQPEILRRDGHRCQQCGGRGFTAHHLYYVRGRLPWQYPNSAFVTLCWEKCHAYLGKVPVLSRDPF